MVTGREDAILNVGVDVNVRTAMASVNALQKHVNSQMQSMARASENMGKKGAQAAAKASKHFDDWRESIEDLEQATEGLQKAYKVLEKQEKELEKLEDDASKRRLKSLREQKKAIQEVVKAHKRAGGGGEAGGTGGGETGSPGNVEIDKKSRDQLAGDIKASFEAAGQLFRKDLRGAWDKISDRFGERAKKGVLNWADSMSQKGARMRARGQAMGGMGGGAMKGLGKMLGSLGPVVKMLASLGPVIIGISSAVAGLVTLLIDAEARAKEFNKQVMEGAQSAEFLRDAGWDATLAMGDLDKTLRAIRESANSLELLTKYGIKKEEFTSTFQALQQEGISMADLNKEATRTMAARYKITEEAARKIGASQEDIQAVTMKYVRTAITASRALGVPVSEVTQMQTEMMHEMGMGVDNVRNSFTQIARTATESGIATNKFFAMIRNVSQDLALYNNRISDAANLLGKLGKVMNPRNAQQFMQWAMGALKGMDQDSRLKLRLLSGDKTKGRITKDLEKKQRDLAGEIGEVLGRSATEVEDILKKGGLKEREKLFDALRAQSPKRAGALVQAANEMMIDRKAVQKGLYGEAAAMRNVSAGVSLDIMRDALKSFGGGKTLAEGIGGLGQDKMAQLLGISEEQVRQMAGLEMHLQGQGQLLAEQVRGGDADAIQRMKDAGLTLAELESGNADMAKLMEALPEKEKQSIEEANKTIEQLTSEQTKHTITIADYLEQLINFIMNQLYGVMVDIWDILNIQWSKGGAERKKLEKQVKLSKDPALMAALEKAGGDPEAFKREVIGTLGAGYKDLQTKALGGDDAATSAIMRMESSLLTGLTKMEEGALVVDREKLTKAIQTSVGLGAEEAAAKAAKVAGLYEQGQTASTALSNIGLSSGQRAYLVEQMGRQLNASDLARMTSSSVSLKKDPTTTAAIEAKAKVKEEQKAAPKPPSAQAQASSKAGGPSAAVDVSGTGTVQPAAGQPAGGKGSAAGQSKGKDIPATFNGQMMIFGALAPLMGLMAMEGTVIENLDKIHQDLRSRGVLLDKGYTQGSLRDALEAATLDALRVALFEFALYQHTDPRELASLAKGKTFDPKTFGKGLVEEAMLTGNLPENLAPNAAGGLVTGVSGGMAVVRPPPGEGMAAIGPGERILPAGASGDTNVNVSVAGIGANDLARIIENKVVEVVYEYKRREGFS